MQRQKIDDDFISENYGSFSIFSFMTNLEQSRSQFLDGEYVKLTFSVMAIFCLTKTIENKTKKSLTQLTTITLSEVTILQKMLIFCPQKC